MPHLTSRGERHEAMYRGDADRAAGAVLLLLTDYQENFQNRKAAMARADLSGAYTMAEIADQFGVHFMTVRRAVREWEGTSRGMEEYEN